MTANHDELWITDGPSCLVFTYCCPICGGDSGHRDEPAECGRCAVARHREIRDERRSRQLDPRSPSTE